ncbi:rhamnan synthesis F family protein [Mesorhizobium sophorae]|uniref:rhamnan synthesis F family protein n=1 Tax=Mesorhizobium sophorae TaxID=1300294 RepID=UPI000BA49C6C|nr:rhamnan synthesis F family protein [Mesorhizobium sophorae]
MRRLAIAFYYDQHGKIDEYYFHLIASIKPFVEKVLVVCNGPVDKEAESRLSEAADSFLIRENKGFDAWAYRTALEHIGWDELSHFDEILLFNHTFYGPIFPFSEMFSEMDQRQCDFWGISAHGAMRPNPIDVRKAELPFHLNSHFIAVRRSLHQSKAFRDYWTQMGPINSYMDSIAKHETVFTGHFQALGYTCSVLLDPARYKTSYPVLMEPDKTLEDRSPILKKRLFFHDTLFLEREAINLPRALEIIENQSDYDLSLIWKSVGRLGPPRTLNGNAALLSVLPDVQVGPQRNWDDYRIAVLAHVYHVDMIDEILGYSENVPKGYDLIITTDNANKQALIEQAIAKAQNVGNAVVLVVENDGRDTSALLIGCRDYVLEDRYDLICRIHSKQSSQDGAKGELFKLHTLENLLHTPGYVSNLLELFANNPALGLVMPPMIHIGYPTLGNSWFGNKDNVQKIAKQLNLIVHLDANSPVAPYGGMYWFRPAALRKLFEHKWAWDDFANMDYRDGSLVHAIERIIAYVAIDAGYTFRHVVTARNAAHNYVMLEAKLQALLADGAPAEFGNLGVARSFRGLLFSIKRSIVTTSPTAFRILRPIYRGLRRIITLGRGATN